MKPFRVILVLAATAALAAGCFPSRSAKPKKPPKVESVAGRTIPSFSLSIDANYDPRLDDLIATLRADAK